MNIELLDCTLRDGGYVNNWEFGHAAILSIFNNLVLAKIENIEVGFLNNSEKHSFDRTINPSVDSYNKIFENINKNHSKVFGMIKYGTFDIASIEPHDERSFIDGIRVIFRKQDIVPALEYCLQIKNKGYFLSINPVSIHTYNETELYQLIELVNKINPQTLSIVDTCGLLDRDTVTNYFSIINKNLLPTIALGYHSHNNFQLAFSNALDLLDLKSNRTLILDGSLYGMGRCAGNACLELLVMYLNKKYSKNYDINSILEVIDKEIIKIRQKYEWGYSLSSFVAALNDCHPNYAKFLMKNNNLSAQETNKILQNIDINKKNIFDENYVNGLL